ncbi:MAG TPA: hypothetical protein VJ111_10840 [Chitinophagaceae bacterium]|nr:hypothetical protein [Chitinophagaceae bacterium]
MGNNDPVLNRITRTGKVYKPGFEKKRIQRLSLPLLLTGSDLICPFVFATERS